MIKLTIKGEPIAKKRPRFVRVPDGVNTYSAQQTDEGSFILQVREQLKGHKIITGPISVLCVFYMKRPKSHYGTGKNDGKIKQNAPKYHIKRPDIDNLIKFAFDCLNGEIWHDDTYVVKVEAHKVYSNTEPKTYIEITYN